MAPVDSDNLIKNVASLKDELASLNASFALELPIDTAVKRALPEGNEPRYAHRHGSSAWSFGVKVMTTNSAGAEEAFFLKYVPGDLGKQQLYGEFCGMMDLYQAAPSLVPKPIAWGILEDTYKGCTFLLLEFKDFAPSLPDPIRLGASVALLHRNSQSPTGEFGYSTQTFDGARLQAVTWQKTWTEFFSKLLSEAYRQDVESNGIWPELRDAHEKVQSLLIPRLIGALEKDGRSIKPTLIHGNMWDGNIGTEASTGKPWIFDCSAYYGHHEMEIGIWRAQRHQLRHKMYRMEYLRNMQPSEPREEWDDRNRLYSAKTNFMYSACYPSSSPRHHVLQDFQYLLAKYTEG